jgi:hypothetical protein
MSVFFTVLHYTFAILIGLVVIAMFAGLVGGFIAMFNERFGVIVGIIVAVLAAPAGYKAYSALIHMDDEREAAKIAAVENPIVYGPVKIERFFLAAKNPPKHYYVTLKHVQSGNVYEHLYVSKHCNNHNDLPLGSQVNVQVREYWRAKTPESKNWEFLNMSSTFCGS